MIRRKCDRIMAKSIILGILLFFIVENHLDVVESKIFSFSSSSSSSSSSSGRDETSSHRLHSHNRSQLTEYDLCPTQNLPSSYLSFHVVFDGELLQLLLMSPSWLRLSFPSSSFNKGAAACTIV